MFTRVLTIAGFGLLAGCAIYHPQRSVLVSSDPQTVDIRSELQKAPRSNLVLRVTTQGATRQRNVATNAYIVGGVYASARHEYRFDAVDEQNFVASLQGSLEDAGFRPPKPEDTSLPVITATVTMTREDMTSSLLGTGCALEATVVFSGRAADVTEVIKVEEVSGWTVSRSKNQAIASFIRAFASKLAAYGQPPGSD